MPGFDHLTLRDNSHSGNISFEEVADALISECGGDARAAIRSEVTLYQVLAKSPPDIVNGHGTEMSRPLHCEALIDDIVRECDGNMWAAVLAMLKLNCELLWDLRKMPDEHR